MTTELDGLLTIDMPRSLHYKLRILAEQEGVPMDLLISNLLTEGITRRKIARDREVAKRLAFLELKGDGWHV